MKLAILDDDTVVPYDHLMLCTGNQFRVIAPMQATVINPLSKKPAPPKADRMLFGTSILAPEPELLLNVSSSIRTGPTECPHRQRRVWSCYGPEMASLESSYWT